MTYNANPSPQAGNGAFGTVPGATSLPPSLWEQLNQNVPNYGAMTSSATGDISSLLSGKLSPSTMMNIDNAATSRGVSMGQPNSPFSDMIGLGLTGQTTEGLQQQGLQDYNTFTGTAGGLQQNPALMSEISQSNAVLGSAPDPSAAAAYSKSLYDQYMAQMNTPAGGTGSFSLSGSPQGNYSQFPMFGGASGGTGSFGSVNYSNGFGGGGSDPYSVWNIGGYGQDNVGF
jgi:hypothetical protein